LRKASVLLVVKNALRLVSGTLESLRHQTFKDFEVVVADGGSTDGTLAALHQAAKELPLRVVSESDRSLADGTAKGLRHLTGDIVGMLSADERYYPDTIERAVKWFEAEPDAVMCGGRTDFIDEQGKVIDSHLTAPFELSAHLACELVPSILASFFNRRVIGDDLRFDAVVPTCPDYEFWARLGVRFPPSAFRRYDVGVAQTYRTRDSMSFRTESFTQFCRDKLTHLNNLLAEKVSGNNVETLRRRSSAGIHMWAAEQLRGIEPDHPDILAHCAAAARYDKSYGRIGRLIASIGGTRYEPTTGIVRRNRLGPRTVSVARFVHERPPSYWPGAAILARDPLTLETAEAPWGYSLLLTADEPGSLGHARCGGQCWALVDLEVISGCVGIGIFTPEHGPIGEQFFQEADGRTTALIPTGLQLERSLIVRSGGKASSVARIHRAELLHDPDAETGIVAPVEL
jgi:glycosyltransferase